MSITTAITTARAAGQILSANLAPLDAPCAVQIAQRDYAIARERESNAPVIGFTIGIGAGVGLLFWRIARR